MARHVRANPLALQRSVHAECASYPMIGPLVGATEASSAFHHFPYSGFPPMRGPAAEQRDVWFRTSCVRRSARSGCPVSTQPLNPGTCRIPLASHVCPLRSVQRWAPSTARRSMLPSRQFCPPIPLGGHPLAAPVSCAGRTVHVLSYKILNL